MRKGMVILFLSGVLAFTLSGCGGQVEQLEILDSPSSGTSLSYVDASKYDDDLNGLCKYMLDNQLVIGEPVEMSYKEIGAIGGFRYRFKFDGGTVQAEFYEFDMDNLDEKGNDCVNSVKEKGYFTVLGNDAPAYLNGKYMMIYTDSDKDEVNTARKEEIEKVFSNFKN